MCNVTKKQLMADMLESDLLNDNDVTSSVEKMFNLIKTYTVKDEGSGKTHISKQDFLDVLCESGLIDKDQTSDQRYYISPYVVNQIDDPINELDTAYTLLVSKLNKKI